MLNINFTKKEIFWIASLTLFGLFVGNFVSVNVSATDIYDVNPSTNKWEGRINTTGDFTLTPSNGNNPVDIFDGSLSTFGTFRCNSDCSAAAPGREAHIYINATEKFFVNRYSLSVNTSGASLLQLMVNFSLRGEDGVYVQMDTRDISEFGVTAASAEGSAFNVTDFIFPKIFTNSTRLTLRYVFSTTLNADNQKVNIRELSVLTSPPVNIKDQFLGKISNISTFNQTSWALNDTVLPSEIDQIRVNSFIFSTGQYFIYVPRLLFFNVSGFSQSVIGAIGGIDETDNSCANAAKIRTESSNTGKFNNTITTIYDEYLFTPSASVTCSFRWQFSSFDPLPTNMSQVWLATFNASTDIWRIGNKTYNTEPAGVNLIIANKENIRLSCSGIQSFCLNDGVGLFVKGTNQQAYGFGIQVSTPIFDSSTSDTIVFSQTNFKAFRIQKEHNFTMLANSPADVKQLWNVSFTFNPSKNNSWVGRDIYLAINERECYPNRVEVIVNGFSADSILVNKDSEGVIQSFYTNLVGQRDFTKEQCQAFYGKDRIRLFYIDRIGDYHNNVTSYNVQFRTLEKSSVTGIDHNIFSLPLFDHNGLKPFSDIAFTQYTITSKSPFAGNDANSISQNYAMIYAANATSSLPLPSSTGLFSYRFNVTHSRTLATIEAATVSLFGANESTLCVTNATGSCNSTTTKEGKLIEVSKSGFDSKIFNTCFIPNTCDLAISPVFTSININVLLNESSTFTDPTFGGTVGIGGLTEQVIVFHGNFSRIIPDKIDINITRTKQEELFIQTFRIDRTSKIPRLQAGLSVVWNATEKPTFRYIYPIFGASSADNEDAYILQVRNASVDRFNQTKFFITSNGNITAFDFELTPQILSSLVESSNNNVQELIARSIDQSIRFAEEQLKVDYLNTLDWIFKTEPGFFLPNMIWLIVITLLISFMVGMNRGRI